MHASNLDKRWRRFLATVFAATVFASALTPQADAQSRKSKKPETNDQFSAVIRQQIDKTLDQLESDGDFKTAEHELISSFDQVIAYADPSDKAAFRDAAYALRLVRQVGASDESSRRERLTFLRKNADLGSALMFVMKEQSDKPAEVFAVLDRLRAKHADILNRYAELTAALCVVHDKPLKRQYNENRVEGTDPVALFEYFVANEKRMFFGIQDVPAELLVYVVDSTASIEEMNWALKRYAGDKNIGVRFFDIKYDVDHFSKGAPKKVTVAGWNLPNILAYGGVCIDQAYFAMTIGKAIGVPTACVRGASSEVSHAWVGFLQSEGKRAWWNFDNGRYEEYKGVRGSVEDPQTRRQIPDGYVSLLADFVASTPINRQAAVGLTDAAQRIFELEKKQLALAPPSAVENAPAVIRHATVADGLALLDAGLTASPGYAEGWFTLQRLASTGKLSYEDKKKWESVLYRLCGQRYPDFYFAVLKPMIETVSEIKEQNALWNGAFGRFEQRPDLAAAVRMEQAELWTQNKDQAKAGQCYEDVINRFANAGPFVIDAVKKAEAILRKGNDGARVLKLYERAWSQIHMPRDMSSAFFKQSNWYRVGDLYAKRLSEAGLTNEANKVRETIEGR